MMTSNKPYFLRALYEWIADNHMVPHINVDASKKYLKIPLQYVKDGQIVLNISMEAAHNLQMDNEAISFNARFGGVPMQVYVPIGAVSAIYARETGEGMMFDTSDDDGGGPPPPPADDKPILSIVK
ncbi:MAG TPA: ClpXP protease specificity-enhancing factor [Gammaproteobacteria bacterium]|nr:ClpXP protease specificity-enhancing factor [Gammaproteobacteria bacterium]